MNALLNPLPLATRSPKLILHCGAHAVPLEQIAAVAMPEATQSWQPIPHIQLIRTVQDTLASNDLTFGAQAHSLTRDGMRYFGLMEVRGQQMSDDYCWVLGLRNSHDKTFPAGVVAGASVFVCDNLSFSGEVKIARKHTRFINRDLPRLIEGAVGRLMEKWHTQDVRIGAYKEKRIGNAEAHDLVIRATDVGVCSNQLIPEILQEWRQPRYPQFEERNMWSLFNAFTEALKGGSLTELPKRAAALHGLLDVHVGLSN